MIVPIFDIPTLPQNVAAIHTAGTALTSVEPGAIRTAPPRQTSPRPLAESPPEPAWVGALAARATRILSLPAGWDGVGSVPVQRRLLDEATRIVRETLTGVPRAAPPHLVPGGDGGIQIEWHQKSGELEFELAADGGRWIWIRDHRSGEEIEGEGERANVLFSRWAARVAAGVDDEGYVLASPNTSTLGTFTRLSIRQNYSVLSRRTK
jgi:hypothetical protein